MNVIDRGRDLRGAKISSRLRLVNQERAGMGIVGVREPDEVATVMGHDRLLFGARKLEDLWIGCSASEDIDAANDVMPGGLERC
ncbi:MAG TPA: hypothetical protein VIJ77_04125 [Candidatus Tumulicola sp.]